MQTVIFLNASRRKGVSKKSNNSYDMFTFVYAVPLKEGDLGSMNVTGLGYEAKEMSLDEKCFFELKESQPEPLQPIQIETSVDLSNPTRNLVVSFSVE